VKLSLILAGLGVSFSLAQASASGLAYLNDMRVEAGLAPLNANADLQRSAQNHSHYLYLNHITGHSEDSSLDGFTGETPAERGIEAGYRSVNISENVSWGQQDVYSSIDKLFAGIYHRFTFLSMGKDEIGIGIEAKHYTFDLGNSRLDDLCRNHTYSWGRYYYNACRDSEKKIEVAAYDEARDHDKSADNAPEIVVWPPRNGNGVLPGFYAENPDPLPDHEVSGYPVSVEFNSVTYPLAPEEVSLTLQDDEGNPLESIMLMDRNNDPQQHLTAHQFALFPLEHLEWGSTYQATLDFDGQSRQWCFATRSLSTFGADRVYRIDQIDDLERSIVSGKTYALYFVPQDSGDMFDRYHYRYNSQKPDISFVDRNTLLVTVSGEAGDTVMITVNRETNQTVTLVIGESDEAEVPAAETCNGTTVWDTHSVESSAQSRATSTDASEDDTSLDVGTTADSAGGFPLLLIGFSLLMALRRLRHSEEMAQ